MTKIVVLGGAGEVGQWVVRDLCARESITEVVLAVDPPEQAGWVAPELAFDPEPFLAALEERQCIPIIQNEEPFDGQALQRPVK